MKFVKEETRLLSGENRIHSVYEFPKESCIKQIEFKKNREYQNPCNPLQRYVQRGKSETDAKENIRQPYKEARHTMLQYRDTI